jgi:hypothetical protein
MRDLSFRDVTCLLIRGLLTWNCTNLLYALPDLLGTLSDYIKKHYIKRKSEIYRLIPLAPSKIAISVNLWTSSNYLSFLGVVAHFVDADYN